MFRVLPLSRVSSRFSRFFSSSSSPSSSAPLDSFHGIEQQNKNRPKTFHDRVRLQVSGGPGGSGCSSFARTDKGKGAPDGGNGGRGGSVFLETSSDLQQFKFTKFHIKGGPGLCGESEGQHGHQGSDCIAFIPPGTMIREIIGKDEATEALKVRHVADLNTGGLRIKVAEGGAGGFGNRVFKTDYRQNNLFSTAGLPGASRWLQLELKAIAEVGLVGLPNAGKSSTLAAISSAKPRIASYPFTTMQPELGCVKLGKFLNPSDLLAMDEEAKEAAGPRFSPYEDFSVADLPGLIEGAHRNAGLGHAFLRHLERCAVLLFVLDLSVTVDDLHRPSPSSVLPFQPAVRDPVADFLLLQKELILYNPQLALKPAIIFANKSDENPQQYRENVKRIKKFIEAAQELEFPQENKRFFTGNNKREETFKINKNIKIIQGSAKQGENIKQLVRELAIEIRKEKRRKQQQFIEIPTSQNKTENSG